MPVIVPLRTGRGLNNREHHMMRYRREKSEQEAVRWMLLGEKRPPLPCEVHLTRLSPPNAAGVWSGLDGDNLQGSLKAVRDAVAEWLGIDDASERVHWAYRQERGEWAVRIEFAERGYA